MSAWADAKLPPRAAFTAQVIGTLFGAVLNYSKGVVRVPELHHSHPLSHDELDCHQST